MTTPQEVPEGERLAKVEADVESLVRDTTEIKADIRDLRSVIDRNFQWTIGLIMPMWVTIIIAIIVAILVR